MYIESKCYIVRPSCPRPSEAFFALLEAVKDEKNVKENCASSDAFFSKILLVDSCTSVHQLYFHLLESRPSASIEDGNEVSPRPNRLVPSPGGGLGI